MSHPSPYPSPPYSGADHIDAHAARPLLVSAWHLLEQPPPPTLREILHAYKSKGDGDRDMLLAMLSAKTAEDQRIAALANLHQKLLDVTFPPQTSLQAVPTLRPSSMNPYRSDSSHFNHSPTLRKDPPDSPQDISRPLPTMHIAQSPRKRARTSRSPPPRRQCSGHGPDHRPATSSEQLPPSPPFSSPGRSAPCPELTSHPSQRDAMAIGSLLSSVREADSDWPSRTSSERDREGLRRHTKVSG